MAHDHDPALEPTPELGHEPGHDDPAGHSGSAHGAGHRGHGAGHGDHGGGHGGSWIVTYCDMVTLLIAFFICILTFASHENGKGDHRRLRDSVLYGPGGNGIAGTRNGHSDCDELSWRQVLIANNPGRVGSPIPPLYSDPTMDVSKRAISILDEPSNETLGDSYATAVPASLLFDSASKLTSSGQHVLHSIAANLRLLPFDIYIQVASAAELPRAWALEQRLLRQENFDPSRVGIGLAPGLSKETIRFVFLWGR